MLHFPEDELVLRFYILILILLFSCPHFLGVSLLKRGVSLIEQLHSVDEASCWSPHRQEFILCMVGRERGDCLWFHNQISNICLGTGLMRFSLHMHMHVLPHEWLLVLETGQMCDWMGRSVHCCSCSPPCVGETLLTRLVTSSTWLLLWESMATLYLCYLLCMDKMNYVSLVMHGTAVHPCVELTSMEEFPYVELP